MKVEVLTTGEEVLSGQITDTNASWLSGVLAENGFAVTRRTTVGDRLDDLVECLRERSRFADILIVNGGLGPTRDDLTAESAAKACEVPLVEFPQWVEALEQKFALINRKVTPENLKQAHLPQGSTLLDNRAGTACGFHLELNGAQLFFTPGVPHEFKIMVREQILPHLKARFQLNKIFVLQRLYSFGIAESNLDALLADIFLPEGFQLGYRPNLAAIEIKIMGSDHNLTAAQTKARKIAEAVRKRIADHLVYEEDERMEPVVQKAMMAKGFQLALAESCTGGMIANQLVSVAGSSGYLEAGYVTYSNRAKTEMIGVPELLIQQFGAVSHQVARAMAEGAVRTAGVSHGLAVTGIAGPGGGTEQKPVGTVGFSLCTPKQTYTQVLQIPPWGRRRIRALAATIALDMLRRHLQEVPVFGNYDYATRTFEETAP